MAKQGWVVSEVEYVKDNDQGHSIAVVHAGSGTGGDWLGGLWLC